MQTGEKEGKGMYLNFFKIQYVFDKIYSRTDSLDKYGILYAEFKVTSFICYCISFV